MGKIISTKGVKTGEGTVSHDNDISQTVSSTLWDDEEEGYVLQRPTVVNNTERGLLMIDFSPIVFHDHFGPILVTDLPYSIVLSGQTVSTTNKAIEKIATLG